MLEKFNENNKIAKIIPKEEFVVKYSPKSCMKRYSGIQSIRLALKENVGSLSQIKKGYGEEFQINFLLLWLADLNESVGVKNKLSADMMEQCAIFIIEDYYYFKISDINLIFTRAKKGFYGNFYESISIPKIIEWFSSYAAERSEIAYNTNLNEHKVDKNKNPLFALAGVKTLQETYFDELGKAKKTKDYSNVDKLLKERKQPGNVYSEENLIKLENKISDHKLMIVQFEQMIENSENELYSHHYLNQINIIKKQLYLDEAKLKEMNINK